MSPGSFLLTLASCLVLTAFQQAGAACPSSHLEPTLDYGRAFGNPVSITTGIDIGPDFHNEEAIFQYVEYQSRDSRDPGYSPVFAIHVFQNEVTRNARLVVGRLKAGKPVLLQMPLSASTVELISTIASPLVRDTHYPKSPCPALYLDGWVIDVGVRWRSENEVKFIGGTAYAPIAGTPAGHLGVLGRALRAVATGELAESELQKALREKGIVKPPG